MSQWLVSSAPPKTTLRIISHIDEECERTTISDEVEIHQGPFGAFRLNQDRDTLPYKPAVNDREQTHSSSPEDVIPPTDPYLASSEMPLSPWSQALLHFTLDGQENVPSPPPPGYLDAVMDQDTRKTIQQPMNIYPHHTF
jgi:arginine metabolism regulation protein II